MNVLLEKKIEEIAHQEPHLFVGSRNKTQDDKQKLSLSNKSANQFRVIRSVC